MLPTVNRLPKKELREVVARGARAEGDGFTIRYGKTGGPTRVAVIVSSKVDKRATQRNRIRRVIHRSVQNLLPRLTPVEAVFIVRKNIAALSQENTEKIIEAVLKQEHLV